MFLQGTCGASTSEGDWYYSNATDECFYFTHKPEPFQSAQAACQVVGANLVTVTDKNHKFITRTANPFAAKPTPFWIGLYQSDPNTQEHLWIDGHVSTFRAWETDEPSQH